MSFFHDLLNRLWPRRGGSSSSRDPSLVGAWQVTFIAATHPFERYLMELGADGSLEWTAVVSTTDAGELELAGSGTWRTEGDTLHYTSGEAGGAVQYALEEGELVLDGLPATKVGPGVRCVLERCAPAGPADGVPLRE